MKFDYLVDTSSHVLCGNVIKPQMYLCHNLACLIVCS